MDENKRDCKHGCQRGKCDSCELDNAIMLLCRAYIVMDSAPIISCPSGLSDDDAREWFRERDAVIEELKSYAT